MKVTAVLIGFLLIESNVTGYAVHDHSQTGDDDDFDDPLFDLDISDESNGKNSQEEINPDGNESPVNLSFTRDVGKETRKRNEGNADASDVLESLLININRHPEVIPTAAEMTADTLLLEHFGRDYADATEPEDTNKTVLTPMRRNINDPWHIPVDAVDPDSFPWSYDSYYPRDSKNAANDYVEYPNVPADLPQERNASTFDLSRMDANVRTQQNYAGGNGYYNEYPVRRSNFENPETEVYYQSNKIRGNGYNWRKPSSRNPCAQYLEFLRYAFEQLNESPEYRYDYVDDYGDEGRLSQIAVKPSPKKPAAYVHPSFARMGAPESEKLSQDSQLKDNDVVNVQSASSISVTIPIRSSTMPSTSSSSQTRSGSTQPHHHSVSSLSVRGGHSPTTLSPAWSSTTELLTRGQGMKEQNIVVTTVPSKTDPTNRMVTFNQVNNRKDLGSSPTAHQALFRTEFKNYEYPSTPSPTYLTSPRWMSSESYFKNLEPTTNKPTTSSPASVTFGESKTPTWMTRKPATPTQQYLSTTEESGNSTSDCNDKMLPCPDTYNVTYPLNGYCNRYVSCESGRAIRRTCPDGLHFNIITKSCDLPHNSICNYACPKTDGYYGIPGDCGGYFVCKNSNAEYRMCPPKMHWSTTKDVCTFADSSTCPMRCSSFNEVVHYEGDCSAYIICLNGVPYYHRCPPNTKFDRAVLTCVPEHLSKCQDDPKLLTKLYNPSHLCRDMHMKVGSEIWCNLFNAKENRVLEH